MSTEPWRPLGIDSEDEIAEYDALHDGVPSWMEPSYWAWVRDAVTAPITPPMLDTDLAEEMCQRLRIALPYLREDMIHRSIGEKQFSAALAAFKAHKQPLQIADYLLAHGGRADRDALSALLERSKSAWEVGTRSGRPGLVRRVPLGVQVAADAVMNRAGRAGTRLAEAWQELYGLNANASTAYRLAIQAVEDAAVPVVSPNNPNATLGTVLKQMEDQRNWRLPMDREHTNAPSGDVLVGMMRMLWHGQHDRHGGQPSAPGNVSIDEATVAVSLAVTLVNWFHAGLVQRRP